MIATIARCGACSLVYPSIQVGNNFQVEVKDHGRPVKGLRVEIRGQSRAFADTDKDGLAIFRNVRPGSYHLSADHDAGIPDGADVEVKLGGPADVTVQLKWPSVEPVLVRSLKGTLRGPDYLAGQSQARLSLALLEGNSGRLLKSAESDNSGEFSFEGVASGLYFLGRKPSGLRAWPGEPLTGLIAVAVDQGAQMDNLDIDLGWTSCGLWYVDQNKCPRPDLQIRQLSGQVVDVTGAAIPGATILLFDRAKGLVDRLQSDSTGKFTSPHSLSGTYEFMVRAPGFTPFRATAHADLTGDPPRRSSLTVQLGLGGGCGSGERR